MRCFFCKTELDGKDYWNMKKVNCSDKAIVVTHGKPQTVEHRCLCCKCMQAIAVIAGECAETG